MRRNDAAPNAGETILVFKPNLSKIIVSFTKIFNYNEIALYEIQETFSKFVKLFRGTQKKLVSAIQVDLTFMYLKQNKRPFHYPSLWQI